MIETWRRSSFLLDRNGEFLFFQALAETQAAETSAYDDSSLW